MTPELLRRAALYGLAGSVFAGCAMLRPGLLNAGESDVAYGPSARHRMDVYVPRGGGGGQPVVLFLYGGSWAEGAKEAYAFVGDAFAARGFVTAIADYRLVPEVRFPAFIEDCALALRFLRDAAPRYGGAPDRIHLLGHSAGAYNAVMLALNPHYLAAAGLPPRAIRSAVGLSGPYDFLPFDVPATRDAFGAASDPLATQPVAFAGRGAPPLLLATGTDDATVAPLNSESLARALKEAGARSVVAKFYPGLDHADTVLALSPLLRWVAPVLGDVEAFLRGLGA